VNTRSFGQSEFQQYGIDALAARAVHLVRRQYERVIHDRRVGIITRPLGFVD
jgi:hypothetical protein